jgi:hypothetical protein
MIAAPFVSRVPRSTLPPQAGEEICAGRDVMEFPFG